MLKPEMKDVLTRSIFLGYLSVGIVIALMTPDSINEIAVVAVFTGLMGDIVPFIRKAAALSPMPAFAEFYFSVMWALMPFVVIAAVLMQTHATKAAFIKTLKERRWVGALLFAVFVPFVLFAAYWYPFPTGVSRLHRLLIGSKPSLAIGATMIMTGIAMFAVGFICWLRWLRIDGPVLDGQSSRFEERLGRRKLFSHVHVSGLAGPR